MVIHSFVGTALLSLEAYFRIQLLELAVVDLSRLIARDSDEISEICIRTLHAEYYGTWYHSNNIFIPVRPGDLKNGLSSE